MEKPRKGRRRREKKPKRQAEYMALLIRSEQQFTCLFKFILVCEATVTAPGQKSPSLVAKGNLSLSKRNKVCMSWNWSQRMERFCGVCVKPPVRYIGNAARVSILGGLTHPQWEKVWPWFTPPKNFFLYSIVSAFNHQRSYGNPLMHTYRVGFTNWPPPPSHTHTHTHT